VWGGWFGIVVSFFGGNERVFDEGDGGRRFAMERGDSEVDKEGGEGWVF
jgi:hypothetical protein